MRSSKPITVTLGKQQAILEAQLATGEFESASEVVRAGLKALDREQKALDELLRARVKEALDDPRPSVPADEAFARIRAHVGARIAGERRR